MSKGVGITTKASQRLKKNQNPLIREKLVPQIKDTKRKKIEGKYNTSSVQNGATMKLNASMVKEKAKENIKMMIKRHMWHMMMI